MSAIEQAQHDDRRSEPRQHVHVTAAWSDGNRARKGEVLDASAHGLFLLPAWTPTDALEEGTPIELRCRVNERTFELEGRVCWVGRSAEHGGEGLGLRIISTHALRSLLSTLE